MPWSTCSLWLTHIGSKVQYVLYSYALKQHEGNCYRPLASIGNWIIIMILVWSLNIFHVFKYKCSTYSGKFATIQQNPPNPLKKKSNITP